MFAQKLVDHKNIFINEWPEKKAAIYVSMVIYSFTASFYGDYSMVCITTTNAR